MADDAPRRQDRTWPFHFALLFVIVFVAFAVSLADTAPSSRIRRPDAGRYNAVLRGDVNARLALAFAPWPSYSQQAAQAALESYTTALPWHSAYRRVGIVKQVFLGQPGLSDLELVAGAKPTARLSTAQRRRLQAEAGLWREIYGRAALTPARAEQLVNRVRRLDLGPLAEPAVAEVYARAGEIQKANAILHGAQRAALIRVAALFGLLGALTVSGFVGTGMLAWFVSRHATTADAPVIPGEAGAAGFAAFYRFLILMLGFSAAAGRVSESPLGDLVASLLGSVVAFTVAMLLLRWDLRRWKQDWREIGLRTLGIGRSLKWGLCGYCAAIPLLLVSLLAALALQRTVLHGQPIEEHPIVPILLKGGLAFWLSLLLGVVVAPIAEEIIFRGALYSALRVRLGMWSSALVSGAVFSAIHPTMPAGFLPILTLGVVLAVLRERTGSVCPSIVCHAANNAVMLLVVTLAY